MAAITRPTTFSPYVSSLYGSFAGKGSDDAPDFMYGSLEVWLTVDGVIRIGPHLSGEIQCEHQLRGRVEVNK